MPPSDPFDAVFAPYVQAAARARGRPDSEVRAPWVFARVWDELGCRPAPGRTVLVTGSKGKGTAARLVAWNLQRAGYRVGLVTSPEELEHFDRIRMNDRAIDADTFARLLDRCMPLLQRGIAAEPGRYLSPTGIFLTVALQWFAQERPDWVVVEGGRGVRFDEIGELRGAVGVLTSILPEHVAALGGLLEAVARDKLSLSQQVPVLVAGPGVRQWPLPGNARIAHAQVQVQGGAMPHWYAQLCGIAAEALHVIEPSIAFVPGPTPSWFRLQWEGRAVLGEALVSADSMDTAALRHALPAQAAVVLGLSDDKDVAGILAGLAAMGLTRVFAFELESEAGHVSSRWVADNPGVHSLGPLDVVAPDVGAVTRSLRCAAEGVDAVYVAGVQVFMRTVRRALGMGRAGFDSMREQG